MQSDNKTAAILVIGDEILSGRTREGNAHHLAGVLSAVGIDLKEIRVVADEQDLIVEAIRALDSSLGGRYDLLFTSGGIGPTHDDVTADAVAQAFGVELGGADYVTIILTATLASIGTAGVPGAGVIMLSLVLASVGLPLEGVAVIAGIDRILDMARTALNVTGDCAVAVVVAKSEGELDQQAYDTPHVLDSPTLEELRQE